MEEQRWKMGDAVVLVGCDDELPILKPRVGQRGIVKYHAGLAPRVLFSDGNFYTVWGKNLRSAPAVEAERPWQVGDRAVFARQDGERFQVFALRNRLGRQCRVETLPDKLGDVRITFAGDPVDVSFCVSGKNLDRVEETVTETPKSTSVDLEALECFERKILSALSLPDDLYGRLREVPREEPRETWSATIVLADGRTVRVPDPDLARWELVERVMAEAVLPVEVRAGEIVVDPQRGRGFAGITREIEHDEGRCWMADMARFVNEEREVSPFERRWAYVTEWRRWRERPVEAERYSGCDSILSCLW